MTAGQACVAATRMLVPQPTARTRCSRRSPRPTPSLTVGPPTDPGCAPWARSSAPPSASGANASSPSPRTTAARSPWAAAGPAGSSGATTSSPPCSTCPTTPTRRRRRRSSARSSASSATTTSTTPCASPTTASTASRRRSTARTSAAATAVARRLRTGAVNVNTVPVQRLRTRRGVQAERARPRARARGHPRVPRAQAHGHRRAPVSRSDAGDNMSNDLNLDWLISVDDHILEPPEPVGRPRAGQGPRPGAAHGARRQRRVLGLRRTSSCPTSGLSAVAGKSKEEFSPEPMTYDEMRPGCYDAKARARGHGPRRHPRLAVLPVAHPLLRPAVLRGQRPGVRLRLPAGLQRLASSTNGAGAAPGRYIPLILIPLWDPQLAAEEMERCAAKGAPRLRLLGEPRAARPADHPRPRAATGTRCWRPRHDMEMVVCMHVGSSSQRAARSRPTRRSWPTWPGAPSARRGDALVAVQRSVHTLPEAQDRACRRARSAGSRTSSSGPSRCSTSSATGCSEACSSTTTPTTDVDLDTIDIRELFRDHVFGCFIDDEHGIASIDEIGEDNIMCETDYPHSDSTWPDCIGVVKARSSTWRRRSSTRSCGATPSGSTGSPRPSRRCSPMPDERTD